VKRQGFAALSFLVGLVLVFASFVPAQAQTDGLMEISAKALGDHECDGSEWHFVITQVESESVAPGSIHVVWANGGSEDVPRDDKFTGGVAHYTTTSNLDSVVVSATTQIYSGWDGQFNLSHGPCDLPPTPTPVDPTPTPVDPTPTPVDPTPTPVDPTPTPVDPTPTPVDPTPTPIVTETPVDPTPTPVPQKTGAGDGIPWNVPAGLLIAGVSLLWFFWKK